MNRRLSDWQRMRVLDHDGRRLGHVFDVVARVEVVDSPPRVEALLIGRGGLARRLGIRRGTARRVSLSDVAEICEGTIVLRAPDGD